MKIRDSGPATGKQPAITKPDASTPNDGKISDQSGPEASLSSVTVPFPFVDLFLKAQNYVKSYFGLKQECSQKGMIDIDGERYILVRAASMSHEFFDLMTSMYQDRGLTEAKNITFCFLYDIAHAIGKADARSFFSKMNLSEPVAKLSAGPVHFSHTGWARVDILPESNPTPDDNYYLIYDHHHSFEADTWAQNDRRTDFPVCIMNAGYSSGWCEESFGIPLAAAEIECRSKGDDRCRFIMAPPGRIKAHIERYSRNCQTNQVDFGTMNIPEFFQRKRLEDELRKHRDHLEDLVRQRTEKLTGINQRLEREIAQRREAYQALQQSEAMFEAIFNQTFHFIGILTLDGAVVKVNQTALWFVGTTEDRIIGCPFWETPWWNSDSGQQQRLRQAVETAAGGRLVRFETEQTAANGQISAIDFSIKPVRDQSGRIVLLVAEGRDITALKTAMEDLKKREAQFKAQSTKLEETNIALKIVLKQVEEKQREDRENILAHVKQFVLPYVNRLKDANGRHNHNLLLNILEANLNDITSPLVSKLSSTFLNLTPMEIRIAHLVKDGLTNKEIAELLQISLNTVSSHRYRIRTKLGLKKKGVNLRSHLLALSK